MNLSEARDRIAFFHGSPMTVLADCMRGFIVAAPGHDLLASDFSAIEARVLAWLAGQEDILDVFRSGDDIYCHEASPIYGRTITKADKNERQVGKVAVLALGYGGGIGAFGTMARGYNLDLEPVFDGLKDGFSEVEIENAELAYASYKGRVSQPLGREAGFAADIIKQRWRKKNSEIVRYWNDLEDAAIHAVNASGRVRRGTGPEGRDVWYKAAGSFLWCKLPSGRVLCYPYPKVEEIETPWGSRKTGLTYMTVDGITGKWARTKTYGGKLAENVTQAVARDLLAESMIRLEDAGYPVVMHVHDEVVCEMPEGAGSVDEMERIMTVVPPWAAGLPIAAEGWRGKRYRK